MKPEEGKINTWIYYQVSAFMSHWLPNLARPSEKPYETNVRTMCPREGKGNP